MINNPNENKKEDIKKYNCEKYYTFNFNQAVSGSMPSRATFSIPANDVSLLI